MDEFSFEERLDNFEVRVRRQAVVIERLATELHALLMVLAQKKLITIDEVYAAERRLDLASEVAQVQRIAKVTRDLESLDAELDDDRRSDAA
jgi:stress response protein YsnF